MTNRVNTLTTAIALVACLLFAPLAAHAQQAGKVYRIGFLTAGKPGAFKIWVAALKKELQKLGYVEGKNIVIEERYGEGRRKRLPALATELVDLKVDIFVTHGSATGAADRAAKAAGKIIPVVFAVSSDPLGAGYVASLARPGGNITGLSDYHANLVPKRLELLKEVIPSVSSLAVLWDPRRPVHQFQMKALQAAAHGFRMTLLPVSFSKPADLNSVFATLRQKRPDALMHFGYPLFGAFHKQIAAFTPKNRLPAIATLERTVAAGFLISYGVFFPDLYRRAANFVDKILKGTKPAEMPVEQPTRFYLTVNLKTAKALGITIPQSILLRADKMIE